MTKCQHCKFPYPDQLVTDFIYAGKRMQVCGICALTLTNKIHGTRKTTFHGEQAEAMRLDALNYLRDLARERTE